MNVWAFDLATNSGAAMGEPPEALSRLNSFAVNLRTSKEQDIFDLAFNFDTYLDHASKFGWPDLVVYEAPPSPHATFRDGDGKPIPQSAEALLLPSMLAVTLTNRAKRKRVRVEKVFPATVRATFIGKANAGRRAQTKQAVIQKCREWGYVPPTCKDDNRCDAVALWHYAQVRWGKWTPPFEIMFGRKVPILNQGAA